ncbi:MULTISPECIES: LysR family transcriptional regulator [Acidiphilium]|jgi:DNA-binding transcriptional LysR family regulator|uniref:LysR family transcriptional regulator n=1 Tax=Acidiphilium multivorum (strain DSM 11245 / JCM 8867 / NBRC 100883 / AIU 301) TaxID=926570 RepID=F0IZV6_ACIMA|nr:MULTISPECIES: LysR substrate-binding domain-containing protein [Acidiphilium]MBU6357683.1 LysR family transcriptional regulator [Rhodospirillales bacterium]EGO96896.1 LysR family transcriptional regulator [Acidiphilium sp. PM]KDM67310.1 HTH-type transcriptional regulator AlsR [Acidiphilium sp. JA12-A1]MDE2328598.1 LysR family transcriptional regulator [Rhodospirillales bacterium]UNC14852.1 LysR family transcriptional regulator [Acidiphilium multivorum]
MELRQLRYFVAVAEELSFSRAAERLNVSQPPLSMQIKALEEELGATLFNRTRRRVEITHAGVLLLDSARKALGELRRAAEVVALSAKGEAGLIRLGFTGSVPMLDMFPRLMRAFRDRYPEIGIELRHMSTAQQLQALLDEELDIGILRPPYYFQAGPGLVAHRIWRDELAVFLPAGHRLAGADGPLELARLGSETFVSVAPDIGCGMYDHFMTLCSEAGFAPRVVQHARELGSVLGLVAAGIGIAILPECYVRIGISDVASRKLGEPGAASELLLAVKPQTASHRVQRFVDIAREQCGMDLA